MVAPSLTLSTCRALSPATTNWPPSQILIPKQVSLQRFSGNSSLLVSRRSVVTRAGPSANTFIFAFFFPLSLLAITIFTAMRIGDRLDQKFLEELAMSEALKEMDEEEEDDDDSIIPSRDEQIVLPRTRNRPKRQL